MEEVTAAPGPHEKPTGIHASQSTDERGRNEPALADDYIEHERTYRLFVKGVALVVAHVFVILVLMALFLL